MTVYLDASVLVALFTDSTQLQRVSRFLSGKDLIASDFAYAEFASAISRLVRMKQLTPGQAREIFTEFDAWSEQFCGRIQAIGSDISATEALLRRLDTSLKTPDALHVIIAQRQDAALATFDEQLARNAAKLGVPVAKVG